ncbi:hypothetical protein [Nostoc sp. CCY0012]|uniref:hypothetical protein n=1 Tax=Nostoc sp. CCY0012 TaxID=1056123 RepID=UPI0039C6655A
MSQQKKKPNGCGCANIPLSVIMLFLGFGGWWFSQKSSRDMMTNLFTNLLAQHQQIATPILNPTPSPDITPTSTPSTTFTPSTPPIPIPTPLKTINPDVNQKPAPQLKTPDTKAPLAQNLWDKKVIRGIYFSRYYITNNANEETIRQRVRKYRSQEK